MIKSEGKKKKTKNNYYNSSFRLGIPEDNMEKEEQNTEKLKMKVTYNDQKLNFLRKKR